MCVSRTHRTRAHVRLKTDSLYLAVDELAHLLLSSSDDARVAVAGVHHSDAGREVQQLLAWQSIVNGGEHRNRSMRVGQLKKMAKISAKMGMAVPQVV